MKYIIDHCKECDCGHKRPIINKKYYLCEVKNKKRLHGDNQKIYKIKKKSTKQSKKDVQLTEVYRRIDDIFHRTGRFYCSGCGRSGVVLTHSHTIPRSRRSDLVLDPNNITLKCIPCHDLYETHSLENMKKMLDFEKLMSYIKEVDEEYYNLLMSKENE